MWGLKGMLTVISALLFFFSVCCLFVCLFFCRWLAYCFPCFQRRFSATFHRLFPTWSCFYMPHLQTRNSSKSLFDRPRTYRCSARPRRQRHRPPIIALFQCSSVSATAASSLEALKASIVDTIRIDVKHS